jgi:hypothetical protein
MDNEISITELNECLDECLTRVGSLYYWAKKAGQEELAQILNSAYKSLSDAEYLMTSEDNDADPGDMDGDFDSAMASAGFGTDEDYNHYEY